MYCVPANQRLTLPIWPSAARVPISDASSLRTVGLVGASGAIAGILGAYMILWPRARILTLIWLFYFIRLAHIPAKYMLGIWFFYQLLMSTASLGGAEGGVAWLAHVGGFAYGWVWFKFIASKRRPMHYSWER